jgi:hypothetical protein
LRCLRKPSPSVFHFAGHFDTILNMAWDYTKAAAAKQAKHDPLWHAERVIRYGLAEKLSAQFLRDHWEELRIPQNRRDFLAVLLWGKQF